MFENIFFLRLDLCRQLDFHFVLRLNEHEMMKPSGERTKRLKTKLKSSCRPTQTKKLKENSFLEQPWITARSCRLQTPEMHHQRGNGKNVSKPETGQRQMSKPMFLNEKSDPSSKQLDDALPDPHPHAQQEQQKFIVVVDLIIGGHSIKSYLAWLVF